MPLSFSKHKNSKKLTLDRFVSIMGILGNFSAYFQAYKIFFEKSVQAVSFSAYLLILVSMSVWLMYGIVRRITPLIVSNIVGIVGVILVLIGFYLYK